MACRQTGFGMIAANSPQEVMDLGAVAHLAGIKGRMPFLHFFDGFRTSHEMQKIEIWDNDMLGEMIDREALSEFRQRANNPITPFCAALPRIRTSSSRPANASTAPTTSLQTPSKRV
jgi:pyruvate-ferredoxin/flavodoxin oxidoreductase